MILFVFEGKEREVDIFKALKELYFSDDEVIVEFTYNTGFHTLYRNLKKNDMSLFRVLQEASKKRKDDKLGAYDEDDFSEVIFPQAAIFEKQCKKYVNTKACCVSILNAFPIFLYDYFK